MKGLNTAIININCMLSVRREKGGNGRGGKEEEGRRVSGGWGGGEGEER